MLFLFVDSNKMIQIQNVCHSSLIRSKSRGISNSTSQKPIETKLLQSYSIFEKIALISNCISIYLHVCKFTRGFLKKWIIYNYLCIDMTTHNYSEKGVNVINNIPCLSFFFILFFYKIDYLDLSHRFCFHI